MLTVADLVAQERTKMCTMKYEKARTECEKLIKIFNECKAETCGDCPLHDKAVSVVDGERATACHLLAFYKRYLEDRIAEAFN